MELFVLKTLLLILAASKSLAFEKESFSLLIPDTIQKSPEAYVCSAYHLNKSEKKFIVAFEPQASMDQVHHMLLYGCSQPGTYNQTWDCGSTMATKHHGHHGHESSLPSGGVCADESNRQILYAWARNAEALELPDGVAFEIGKGTEIKHLVLQIHYAHAPPVKEDGSIRDASGVTVTYTRTPAGIFILSSGGEIPPRSTEHLEVACNLDDEDIEIHPFRFRTHTHNLGKFVSGYHVRRDHNDEDQWTWTRIGKRDPSEPQMFYTVENNVIVRKGDVLAARCTMVNEREFTTRVGPTSDDEMCNFYIMYWSEKGLLSRSGCGSPGAPTFYWDKIDSEYPEYPDLQLNNLPPHTETDE